MSLLERLAVGGIVLTQLIGCVDKGSIGQVQDSPAQEEPQEQKPYKHINPNSIQGPTPSSPPPEEKHRLERQRKRQKKIERTLKRFARLPQAEQAGHYGNIESLIRNETAYGQEFEDVYHTIINRHITAVYRPRKEHGGLTHGEHHPQLGHVIIMDMREPSYLGSVRALLRAGAAKEKSSLIEHNWLSMKYHEFLHVLTLDQELQPHDNLKASHRATGRDWSLQEYLKTLRGFSITPQHRKTGTYQEYKKQVEKNGVESVMVKDLTDMVALEMYGISTALEVLAYHVANNLSASEILEQLRVNKYPDQDIGGISLEQVEGIMHAVDRLYTLDLDDYQVAGIIAQTAWSYDAYTRKYMALEDTVKTRMRELHRFGMETDARAGTARARKNEQFAQVREVVEDYLLHNF